MKKIVTLSVLALCAFMQVQAISISRSEAREIAALVAEIDDQSSDDVPNQAYYTFSRGAGKGYVIVSGDDQTAPIIGIVDQGDFAEDQLPVQLKEMLGGWKARIEKLQAEPDRKPSRKKARQRVRESILGVDEFKADWTSVSPLCKTHWHQSSPYNDLAPRRTDNNNKALSGCVATAGSQVLYYFRKDLPDTLVYATPTYGYGGAPVTESLPAGTPIEYDLMKLSGSGTAKENKAVATLVYAVGTSSYLTYAMDEGTATGGYIGDDGMNKAFANQFRLSCQDKWKWAYTQKGWEQLAYKNLSEGRPMVYSGVHETSGGHAVVLDGYNAATGLYHFNFGWGGQGDGYYTIDDETGMNHFNTYQEMLSGAAPMKQNLSGRIVTTEMWDRCSNEIRCLVKNNGTLDYSGFYLWVSTTGKRPASTSSTETATVIASGDSTIISFKYKPTQDKTYYLFLTDKNSNPLDTVAILPQTSIADLSLNSFSIDAGTTTETFEGNTYQRVNNTNADIKAQFTNSTNGTYCEPQVKCLIKKYNTETKEWEASKSKSITISQMQSGETRDTVFTFSSLAEGTYYKLYFDRTVKAGEESALNIVPADTVIYFTVVAPTLAISGEGRNATVSGAWNGARFTKLATDTAVTSYDLTAVSELNSQPVAANPNALFTAATAVEGASNIIVGGTCDNLQLVAGYDFKPAAAFKATNASITFPELKAGHWIDAIVPFDAERPQGFVVREILELKSASMQLDTIARTKIDAMTPLMLLTDYDLRNTITASNVEISTDSVGYLLDGLVSGHTTTTRLTASAALLGYDKNGYPYYYTADSAALVKPFTTVLNKTPRNGIKALNTVGLDRAYILLADTLNRALSIYDAYKATADKQRLAVFADSIAKAEAMLMGQTAEGASDVTKQTRLLSDAIEAFLSGAVVDGISIISTEPRNSSDDRYYYDLSGRRILSPSQGGIYIKGGRKVIF